MIYGTAVGEMLTDEYGNIRYLYNARPDDVSLLRDPNDFSRILVCRADAVPTPVKHQERILFTALDAEPGSLYGTSVLYGLPFVSSVLLKIFEATKSNWDRVGNVRFAVTYKPDGEALSKSFAKERAELIASEWSEAMKSGSVKDFVAVGDVDIKVIGADNQIPDSEIPVREMLEQIVAKLGIPPFCSDSRGQPPRRCPRWRRTFDYGAVALQKTFDACNRKDLLNISSQFWLILKTERCMGRHHASGRGGKCQSKAVFGTGKST